MSSAGGGYHAPKRDLVSNLQVLFQTGRLRIARGLSLAPVFEKELLNFKAKINIATGHDSYEAWREGQHDDARAPANGSARRFPGKLPG